MRKHKDHTRIHCKLFSRSVCENSMKYINCKEILHEISYFNVPERYGFVSTAIYVDYRKFNNRKHIITEI